ncbi:thyroid hormone-inducible hepatic protein [Toxotes jaculatrix]|uniref:thyroid hormone-inducible hepatic protein n=1 Tax=Toxotes jaculatrix TaxID=941984 RepID=UPI001B3ACD29|nr:thyroid hormone-inducible hepatic protein [Toxotes jaculatrix]
MQSVEAKFNRNSLLLALRRYSSAVSDMEQTILLPSLLRDVPSDEVWDSEAAEESCRCRDLYGNYLMLKAIRNTVESGLVPLDDPKTKNSTVLSKTLEPLLDTDPEALFRFHLKGLFSVMSELTKKTQNLTGKYMDIIGAAN